MTGDSNEHLKREANPDAVLRWKAERLVAPFQHRMESWSSEVARLAAVRLRDRNEEFTSKVATLLGMVDETRREFDVALALTTADASRHSIARDVRRAFERLRDQLLLLQH